ncbi:MAG: NAD-dependent dehydratase [Gemmatimonadetes bacterium]|nr:NAD-dependent dehydratase [Gemmatimonadota bacterium]
MILVTGATGFVGREVVAAAVQRGFQVRAAVRRTPVSPVAGAEYFLGADLADDNDWTAALAGVDAVVHTAARVHVMNDESHEPISEFRKINVAASVNLARQAAAAGVRRFIFISSVKVNGERNVGDRPFCEIDPAAPVEPYGISKREAENGLYRVAKETGLEIVVIRPPLVYGPGAKANFAALVRAVARGIPLPLAAIRNKRSLIALDNLVDFVLVCITHSAAANETFLVSDGEDLTTSELIRRIGTALRRPARLIPIPKWVLVLGATVLFKRDLVRRLLDSLRIDSSKARTLLGWAPPLSVDEGLEKAVRLLRRDANA